MSASGINPTWRRDYFTRHRICRCSPEQECRHCDGGAAYSNEIAAIAAAVAAVAEREQRRTKPERRAP